MKKLYPYIIGAIVLFFGILFWNQYSQIKSLRDLVDNQKDIILDSDTLREVEGVSQKLVDDRLTTKELMAIIAMNNAQIASVLRSQNQKPITYTTVMAQPERATTTQVLRDTFYKDRPSKFFEDYYPSKDSFFIQYQGILTEDDLRGTWDFNPMKIGIVVSEKSEGIYETTLDAPDWLQIQDIQVNALPVNPTVDNFGWLLGGEVGYNPLLQQPFLGLYGGVRIKNKSILIGGSTTADISLQLYVEF